MQTFHLKYFAASAQHFSVEKCLREVALRLSQHGIIQLHVVIVQSVPSMRSSFAQSGQQILGILRGAGICGEERDSTGQARDCVQIPHSRVRLCSQALE